MEPTSANVVSSKQAMNRPLLAAVLMTVASLCFALMAASAKWATEYVPSPIAVFARSLIVLLAVAGYMRIQAITPSGTRRGLLHLRGLLGTCALNLYYLALSVAPLAETVVLANTMPLFVPLLAYAALGETPRPALLGVLVLGFAGVVLIAAPQGDVANPGLLAALGVGVFGASSAVCVRKLHETEHPLTIVYIFALWATLTSLPWLATLTDRPQPLAYVPLGLAGGFALAGQVLSSWALKFSPAAIVSVFYNVGVVMTLLIGLVFWNEWPSPRALLGALAIVAACTLSSLFAQRLVWQR